MQTAYMYFDEAGNFDFSATGTRHFIMTCMVTRRPFAVHPGLLDIKYDCLEQGLSLDRFHATEDRQAVRDRVYEAILSRLLDYQVYTVIIRKNRTNPTLYDERRLYPLVFDWLTKYSCRRSLNAVDHVVAVTDRIPVAKKQAEVKQALKRTLKENLEGRTYALFHHESRSDLNLQIVDYFNWAIQRKWELDDPRSYVLIKGALRGEGDLFRAGDCEYY